MMTTRWTTMGAALAMLAMGACSSDDAGGTSTGTTGTDAANQDSSSQDSSTPTPVLVKSDTSGIFYQNEALGLTISEFEEWGNPEGGEFKTREDGTFELYGEARVSVDGVGDRYVSTAMFAEPSDVGDRVTVITIDSDTEQERHFHYDPSERLLVIGDEDGGVFVFKEPDGTYGVVTSLFSESPDDASIELAETGYEAWQILGQYNQFTETSSFSLLMAYGLVNAPPRPVLTTWGPCVDPCCQQPGGARKPKADGALCCVQITAGLSRFHRPCSECVPSTFVQCEEVSADSGLPPAPKPVCEVFEELCDCIACQAAGHGENCELCAAP